MAKPQSHALDSVKTGHKCMTATKLGPPPGVSKVFADGIFPATMGTPTIVHLYRVGDKCKPHVKTITTASSKVFAQGKPAATITSKIDKGIVTQGSGNVFSA